MTSSFELPPNPEQLPESEPLRAEVTPESELPPFEPYIDREEKLLYVNPYLAYEIDDLDKWEATLERVKKLPCDHAKLMECTLGPGSVPGWSELNIQHAEILESLRPGSVSLLQSRFNLEHFARYPVELLLDMCESVSRPGPWGLVVYAKADHNDAFYYQKDQLLKMQDAVGSKCRTRVIESDNTEELMEMLSKMKNRYGEASFLVVCGHGSENGIALGEGSDEQARFERGSEATDAFAATARSCLKSGAEICLLSCSTGIPNGIGEEMAEKSGVSVSAPNTDTALESFGAELHGDNVSFKPQYMLGSTKRYDQSDAAKEPEEGQEEEMRKAREVGKFFFL